MAASEREHRDPGDFGRRVALRRQELGLSRKELADRAGIDAGYLEYLEERPGARPAAETRLHLARALSTTVERLQGSGFGEPVGTGHPPAGVAEVHELDLEECHALLRYGGVARVIFVADRGPVALPVNFRMLGEDIVFRTGDGSIRQAVSAGAALGFEIDRLDDALGEGWSVLATGHGELVEDQAALEDIAALDIRSWAGADRPRVVRLRIDELTGRRIERRLPG